MQSRLFPLAFLIGVFLAGAGQTPVEAGFLFRSQSDSDASGFPDALVGSSMAVMPPHRANQHHDPDKFRSYSGPGMSTSTTTSPGDVTSPFGVLERPVIRASTSLGWLREMGFIGPRRPFESGIFRPPRECGDAA
jgi:hypothetical protein